MRRKPKIIVSVFICLCILSATGVAQSGRKQKKVEPQPPVQGVNRPEARVQPEPDAESEKPKEKDRGPTIMVMTGMTDLNIPMYYADIARQGCIAEFREELKSSDIREGRNQNRSDAIKMAKDDDRTYVVLIELEYDRFGNSMTGVDLRYTVFEPKTAKVIATGSGYPTQPTGRTPIPPIGASREQVYLEWAARDVARQVMKRLNLRGLPLKYSGFSAE